MSEGVSQESGWCLTLYSLINQPMWRKPKPIIENTIWKKMKWKWKLYENNGRNEIMKPKAAEEEEIEEESWKC